MPCGNLLKNAKEEPGVQLGGGCLSPGESRWWQLGLRWCRWREVSESEACERWSLQLYVEKSEGRRPDLRSEELGGCGAVDGIGDTEGSGVPEQIEFRLGPGVGVPET